MPEFLQGTRLNLEIENLLKNANNYLLLISPFIKLHSRYKSELTEYKVNQGIEVVIVFGKNPEDLSKSFTAEDFQFFKDFPNIEIRYEKHLHAKYYANESSAILTSMNLYNYSQDNNIEAGVLIKGNGFLGNLSNKLINHEDSFEDQTRDYFEKVIKQSELLYKRVPHYEISKLGFSKTYIKSDTQTDSLSKIYHQNNPREKKNNLESNTVNDNFIIKSEIKSVPMGYCVRTGVAIPFDQKHPMCDTAFQSWKKFGNKEYEEKYCHFTGEFSNGETSFLKPILRKNWSKAKENYKL